jgi:ATP-dependent RNA helicase SUPV3L1/SUV3
LIQQEQLFGEIRESLQNAHHAFQASSLFEDGEVYLRNPKQAESVLQTLDDIYVHFQLKQKEFSGLQSLFEKEFSAIEDFNNRELVIETIFLEDFLFPEQEKMPLVIEEEFQENILQDHLVAFKDWCQVKIEGHGITQKWIKEEFDVTKKLSDLDCQCIHCVGDYRAKLRDTVYKEQNVKIISLEEQLHEEVLHKKIDQVAKRVVDLKKELDKAIHSIRYRLKRSSLNKLDADIKNAFKDKFSPNSELAKVYKEKLRVYFNSVLVEMGHKPDLLEDHEFERFYVQLGVNIWKPAKFLRREFQKTVHSVLAFKRQDISATILKDYLGQFWLHSEARRIKRKIIYHMGPTNSGKTYHAIQALCEADKGCYLAPLRLLASELYDTMNEKGVCTTLLTGEEVIEKEDATHYSSTIEMAKLHERFDTVVIDEIQMITDPQRGWAWTRALVNIVANEIHLCGDHSALDLVEQILKLTGDELEIKQYNRMTELKVEDQPINLNQLQRGDALIVFSRRNALKFKALLEDIGFKVSIVYGRLSPEVRREQARKFDQGETDIMVSTDAIAMGMNLPVRRIVFSALSKFFNNKEYHLTDSEIKQIAGRAGRFKRFPTGFVTTLERVEGGLERLHKALQVTLKQKTDAMVGPDLEIFSSVNNALEENNLQSLSLTEFLRLFNTMSFDKPFYCVDLREMIEISDMVEQADFDNNLLHSESFGFACAPVNLGLIEHVQYFVWILNHFVREQEIINEEIDVKSTSIDYLEAAIKCVELYQWLARHFDNKNFSFDEVALLKNKSQAIEKLNELLSDKTDIEDYRVPQRNRGYRGGEDRRKRQYKDGQKRGKSFKNGKTTKKTTFKKKRGKKSSKSSAFKKYR